MVRDRTRRSRWLKASTAGGALNPPEVRQSRSRGPSGVYRRPHGALGYRRQWEVKHMVGTEDAARNGQAITKPAPAPSPQGVSLDAVLGHVVWLMLNIPAYRHVFL